MCKNTVWRFLRGVLCRSSRDHRAIGGFSMGGVTTWYALAETLGCFRYFLPMSGDCWSLGRFAGMNRPQETARYLAEVVRQSPYGDAFYIWAASGTNDSAYREILVQIEAMADITDVFGLSKMTFHEKDGARHEFLPTAEYVYNALPFFFPPGHTVQDAPYTTYIRERHLIPYPHLTFSYLPRYLRIG